MVIAKRTIESGVVIESVTMSGADISHVFRQADYDHISSEVEIYPGVQTHILSDQTPVPLFGLGVVSGKMRV